MLLDKLIHLVYVLLPESQLLYLFLFLVLGFGSFLLGRRHNQRISSSRSIQHLLNHRLMVGMPISIQRVELLNLTGINIRKYIPHLVRCQINRSHPIAILQQIASPLLNQSLGNTPIPQFTSIMQSRATIIIPLINTHPCTQQQKRILKFIRFSSDMQRSVPEVRQSINVYPWMVDQSAQNLHCWTHSRVVKRSPVRLISVIHINRRRCIFLL